MLSLSFEVGAPLFYTFRVPTSTSIIKSFTVPPFTTIRGLLSNAIGLSRDDFSLQDGDLKIGLKVKSPPYRNMETARMLKYIARNEIKEPFRRSFPSSPMTKEILFKPEYKIFLIGNNDLISNIAKSLKDPFRPLYLGQSDDFAIISELQQLEAFTIQSSSVHSIIEGVHPNCEIVKLPYKYIYAQNSASLLYKTFSLPSSYPYQLKKELECYLIGQDNVAIY